MPDAAVFSSAEAAAYCGMGKTTWGRVRAMGQAPRALRLTGRTLGYRKRDLDAWLEGRREAA